MIQEQTQENLPPGTQAWVLGSGKIGHEVNCMGVARELGLNPDMREIRPRLLFQGLAPYGPVDPRDRLGRAEGALAGPLPDIVFASGRTTVPYLRHIRKASKGRIFTVFLQDPRSGAGTADLVWVPEHDRLRGENVFVTLTSPHPLRPSLLHAARAQPDPRLSSLPEPRIAMVLGGASSSHRFEPVDIQALCGVAAEILTTGQGLMITPSRRTPPELTAALGQAISTSAHRDHAFLWDGSGDNPYAQMLAHASAIVVTGDSVNMVGEAASTGAPVYIYEPSGGHDKMTGFLDKLVATGAAKRLGMQRNAGWAHERWTYEPVDATQSIAREVVRRYRLFKGL